MDDEARRYQENIDRMYQRAMATTPLRLHEHATWRARLEGLTPEQIATEVYRSFMHTKSYASQDRENLRRVIEVVIELAKEDVAAFRRPEAYHDDERQED